MRTSFTFVLGSIATGRSTKPAYGYWNVYEPEPVQPIPWQDDKQPVGGVDALPDGDIDLVELGARMRTQKPQI